MSLMATILSHFVVCLHFVYNALCKRKKIIAVLFILKSIKLVCFGCALWGHAKKGFAYLKYERN